MFSIADMSFLHWVLVSVYLFWTPTDSFGQMKGSFFEDILDVFLLGLISFAHCWGYSFLSAYVLLRNAFGLNLSS